jgi:hypothetical protein
MKYEIGKYVKQHSSYESADQCLVCGKGLKETDVEIKVALTENGTLSTLDEIQSTWYGIDFSARVGTDCIKKFAKESIFTLNADGGVQ